MGFYDREYRKKGVSFFAILGVFCWLFFAANETYAACVKHEVNNAQEAVNIITDHWEEDYFQEMVIKKGSNRINVDQKISTFTDTFSEDVVGMKEAVSSKCALESFFEEKMEKEGEVYEVKEVKEGEYSVRAPYQSKRIVIQSADVQADYGAVEKYVYKEMDKTILLFETAKKTQIAYEKICEKYGKKECYVDEILKGENLTQATKCYSWGGEVMGMDSLRTESVAMGKAPITVAVLDTGIDTSNTIFQGKKILNDSYNFMAGEYNVKDTKGHGTHVAGIIANLTPDNVRFLILKVTNEKGESTALSMNLALDYAIANNVQVVNISMGFMGQEAKYYTFLDESINNAYKKGIPVCVAAGNDDKGIYGRKVENCYPACNSQAITVSSMDSNKQLAWYSCRGSVIDFTAPGSEVISAGINGKFVKSSGTSMAAPHIAATMAYMKLMNGQLSVDGCCMELRKRCVDLGSSGWDSLYGYGYPRLTGLFQSTSTYNDWTISRSLSAPVLLSVNNVKNGMKLTWKSVKNADGYNIYCKKNGEIASRIARVGKTVTEYVDTTVVNDDINLYYVEAYGNRSGGETISPRSNYISSLVVRPLTMSKVKVWRKKNLAITLKGKINRQGGMIQIQYSKHKNFKKVKSKRFYLGRSLYRFNPKMKGNVYLRVRSVMNLNGKKYYSAWSAVKKVKVK